MTYCFFNLMVIYKNKNKDNFVSKFYQKIHMKIFFIIKGLYNSGGIERVTTLVANKLNERGHTIGLVCLERGHSFYVVNKEVSIYHLPKSILLRIKNLRKLYTMERPDIVVFVGSHRLLMNLSAAKGIPSVTWEHFNANINWHPLHTISRKLAVKYCNKIVTLTERDSELYKSKWKAKNTICISNPLTMSDIKPTSLTSKRVLAVGRLSNQKGFDMLLAAWTKTKQRQNGWKLRIVGSGSHFKKLQRQIKKNKIHNSVEIIPATKDIAKEYQQASIMAMSSRYEGLPLVLIEAMAAGLPIVSFNCETGPAEIIEQNRTGLLVPPLDVEKLAIALDKLMKDKHFQKKYSKQALESVKRFSIDHIISKWESLFLTLKKAV